MKKPKTIEITISQLPFGERLKGIYNNMLNRCYNNDNPNYKYYGGRGIKVCDEWRNDFMAFYKWSIEQGYAYQQLKGKRNYWSIDRINNDGNYEPLNCRWTSSKVQANNRRIILRQETPTYYPFTQVRVKEHKQQHITQITIVDEKGTHILRGANQ